MFHYIKNAMPLDAPGSLSDADVYGLMAFFLQAKGIVPPNTIMNAQALRKVVIPTNGFIPATCPKELGGLGKLEQMKDGRLVVPAPLPGRGPAGTVTGPAKAESCTQDPRQNRRRNPPLNSLRCDRRLSPHPALRRSRSFVSASLGTAAG